MSSRERSIVDVPGLAFPEERDASYAPGLRVGDWVYVSGMTAVDEGGTVADPAFEPQVRQTLENVERTLERAGSSLADVYALTVWLTDMRTLEDFHAVCRDALGDARVAMTVVGAGALLDPEARVMVEARALAADAEVESEVVSVPGLADEARLPRNVAQAVAVGDLVFVSGQPGVDEHHDLVSREFDGQMQRVLENVVAALEAGGSDAENLVATTTWMRDHRDRPSFHRRRSEVLGTQVSTSTRVGVPELYHEESSVEIDAIGVDAAVGKVMVDHPEALALATMERDGETYPRFWQCIAAGDWLFTSGMVGVDAEFRTTSTAFEPQLRRVLENVEIALEAAGADLGDLVHTRTHLTDMRYADAFLSVRDEVWGGTRATSTITHSPLLAEKDFKVEVEAIAVRPEGR